MVSKRDKIDKPDWINRVSRRMADTIDSEEFVKIQAKYAYNEALKQMNKRIFISMFFCISFMLLSAALFYFYEKYNFTYAQAFWFCFVSFATIGYGDFTLDSKSGVVVFIIVIILGVSLTTAMFALIIDRVQFALKHNIEKNKTDKENYQSKKTKKKGFMGLLQFSSGLSVRLDSNEATNSTFLAPANAYPYSAFILESLGGFVCGGVLIGDRWVLTAAQCGIKAQVEGVTVMLGETNIRQKQGLDIEKGYVHSEFNEKTLENDIAILKLAETVNIPPIKIDKNDVGDHIRVRSVGWGLKTGPNKMLSSMLRQADLSLKDSRECKIIDRDFMGNGLGKQVCVGNTENKGTCSGHSGAPLLRPIDGGWKLLGLLSFAGGPSGNDQDTLCGADFEVGFYTHVYKYMDFITQATQMSETSFI
ncbi:hypothetical protein BB561_001786 [Smittium simulii]|uniref:Peptidase S1 domain-containing protein n=1 Tax=Smittium simulii TaxID=133385 RepID=A0A2T9YT91_9FUNG|nr:hypothetical protein BB561_001786 [Smittium simulii]